MHAKPWTTRLREAAYRVAGLCTICATLGLSVASAMAGAEAIMPGAGPVPVTAIVDTSAAPSPDLRARALRLEFARRAAEAALRHAAGAEAAPLLASIHAAAGSGLVTRRAAVAAERARAADPLATLARRSDAPGASKALRDAHRRMAGQVAVLDLTLDLLDLEMARRGL